MLLSNFERNTWKLVAARRKKLHSSLRNKKEAHWRGELVAKLRSRLPDARFTEGISVAFAGQSTEIDLVVLSEHEAFLLLIELKWQNHPDSITEVHRLEEYLAEGVEQARLAERWALANRATIAERLGVADTRIEGCRVASLVLSKNSVGGGSVGDNQVPVVSEPILYWMLRDSRPFLLSGFWTVASERAFRVREGEHFETVAKQVEYGGYAFVSKSGGMRFLKGFDPAVDIHY